MPVRRDVLKAALAAASPMRLESTSTLIFPPVAEWLRLDDELVRLSCALELLEKAALARGEDWDDCPAIAANNEAQKAVCGQMQAIIRRTAAAPASNLRDIAAKLVLWRHASRDFTENAYDALPLSACEDLVVLSK